MNKPLATLVAAAAGALAMYYLDPELGARRRALLASLVSDGMRAPRRTGPGRGRSGQRGTERSALGDPRNDAELRSRIRAALDRMVSHPGALNVTVEDGVVRLSGRVLAQERDGVLEQVQRLPGVARLVNAMSAHGDPQDIARRDAPVPLERASR